MLFRKDRLCRCGGGILAYVRLKIPINRRTELETSELEILWLEIDYPQIKPIRIAGVYRPPGIDTAIDSKIEDNLLQGYFDGKEFYALGDFNISMHDLFAINHKLIQGLYSTSMTQFIETTTRPAKDTLLDHIWCSNVNNFLTLYRCETHQQLKNLK